jgi:hypothetical protein
MGNKRVVAYRFRKGRVPDVERREAEEDVPAKDDHSQRNCTTEL